MSNQNQKDDALFEALAKSKKKRRRKIITTVIIVVLVLVIAAVVGISYLRRSVRERFASTAGEVLSYEASTGTISTVVSGSGTLANVDTESITVPAGVEVTEVLVKRNDTVEAGDVLATVDMASVRSAMAGLQAQIDDLDDQISEAEDDRVSSSITAGVSGRVKIIHAAKGADVVSTMAEQGALAVLSLDGYMALDMETDALTAGDSVKVIRADGTEISGTVETAAAGSATILVTDNGPEFDEEVKVVSSDGSELGSAKLYIHNPLAITGYAGTVSTVAVSENQKVSSGTRLFTLADTSYSANYDSLLRSRSEVEETLLELLGIQRGGAILAPISGSVYALTDVTEGTEDFEIMTLSPDESMSVTISVDESDILSLELGQEADVTVSSVSEDTLTGTVTEIDTSAESGSYTAVITLDKVSGMLPGMTASVDVKIEGVEDAILIPVDALHQTSTGAYVYTSYDEETREYGGKVDVEVGLSNSNYVEIKSGLSVGDTVYYTESASIMDMFGGMMGGGKGNMSGMTAVIGGDDSSGSFGGFGGGEMPDRSNMPGAGNTSGGRGGNG